MNDVAMLTERLIGSDQVISVILIRHCETLSNSHGVVDGHSSSELTDLGRAQAEALRSHLSKMPAAWLDQSQTKWIVSPLKRAIETATALIPEGEFETDDNFCEVDVGKVMGMAWKDAITNQVIPKDHNVYDVFPDGESFLSAQARAINAIVPRLNKLSCNIVVVSHGGIIALLILGLMGIQLEKFPFLEIDNGSLSIIDFHRLNEKWIPKIRSLNVVPTVSSSVT